MKNNMKLLNKILDERNIFNSIYSMESYVFERGLLDSTKPVFHVDENGIEKNIIAANDLELYYALSDKHNIEFIESVISCCQEKLKWIFKDKNNLFNITVYFKLKNYDSENKQLKFRPIHTARL